jgi:ssDNA-binding Zn-finger/Zn-ribbon topoisomerase 1
MNNHPKVKFFPLCDLHHGPMRRVMLEQGAADETQSFHQCERCGCSRIFRDGHGYSDFVAGNFDASRMSSRECPTCGGTLYLAEVDQALKEETWECAEIECSYAEDVPSPSSR